MEDPSPLAQRSCDQFRVPRALRHPETLKNAKKRYKNEARRELVACNKLHAVINEHAGVTTAGSTVHHATQGNNPNHRTNCNQKHVYHQMQRKPT